MQEAIVEGGLRAEAVLLLLKIVGGKPLVGEEVAAFELTKLRHAGSLPATPTLENGLQRPAGRSTLPLSPRLGAVRSVAAPRTTRLTLPRRAQSTRRCLELYSSGGVHRSP
jgi:hypothetical protein